MSRPNKTPHIVRDAQGRIRLKIKAGRAWGIGAGAVAHFFDTTGKRVTRQGDPVGQRSTDTFVATEWDLPDAPPAPPPPWEPNLQAALDAAARAPTFKALLSEAQRAGWSIVLAATRGEAGCRMGPNVVAIDATRRTAFFPNLVYGVCLARSLGPPFPVLATKDPDFARKNAVFLLGRDAEARFDAARIRDELLAIGSADIGGPGLRGSQITAYLRFVEGVMSRDEAIAAIASSVDSVDGSTYLEGRGTRASVELESAFGRAAGAELTTPLPSDAIDVVERVQALRALRPESVGDALDLDLVECDANPHFVTLVGSSDRRSFASAELRYPTRNAGGPTPRLVLVPGPEASVGMAAFREWFGAGIPHHLDTWGHSHATVSYQTDTHTLHITYSVAQDLVASLTFEGRGADQAEHPQQQSGPVSGRSPGNRVEIPLNCVTPRQLSHAT